MSEVALRSDKRDRPRSNHRGSVRNDGSRDASETQQEQIARRAYEIFEASGRRPGCCVRNWERAEREVRDQTVKVRR